MANTPTKNPPVVYAEDDSEVRQTTVQVLERKGYTNIHQCENGRAALETIEELVRQGQKPILLTDWNMPVMDGVQLLQALASKHLEIPAVIMSARKQDVEEAMKKAGVKADVVLAKPVSGDDLQKALETAGRHEGSDRANGARADTASQNHIGFGR